MKTTLGAMAAAALLSSYGIAAEAVWQAGKAPLMTRWAKDVSPDKALAEYPRPQMVRDGWRNLNGLWDHAITAKDAPRPETWDGPILVPFPVESALSGVMKRLGEKQRLWYHRRFSVPAEWQGKHILMHFGAVDWEAVVSVNGKELTTHRGGYDGFDLDITSALKPDGEQELVVAVWDPSDHGPQPRGKQILNPGGIFYTPTSGIWQTVWLEAVPAAYISNVRIVPDVDNQCLRVMAEVAGESGGMTVSVIASEGSKTLSVKSGAPGKEIVVPIPDPKLWSPDAPFLYDLAVTLGKDQDLVTSYFGMRKISSVKDADGNLRLCLNNHPLFQFGPLDQGFWPDGLYTAPTDEALRYDIETTKALGFNMIRKHVKVEPERWYYWCDKLGILVWQDMPSGEVGDTKTDAMRPGREDAAKQFETELKALVAGRFNHPSIVMWVPFNEGWGQHETARYADLVKRLDPGRLVNNASGWTDRQAGDVNDMHHYPAPAVPKHDGRRASVLGEFGGLGMPTAGHLWRGDRNWGYQTYQTGADLTAGYVGLMKQLRARVAQGLAAAVYTQTTDCEGEVNGLMTYDREMIKMDKEAVAAANRAVYLPPPHVSVVAPAADTAPALWRHTTSKPADDWIQPGYVDAEWQEAKGGFGKSGTPGSVIGTEWLTSDIWLRREVELTAEQCHDLSFWLHHDEDVEIYVNGVRAFRGYGYVTAYEVAPMNAVGQAAFKPGRNLLAVHCHQTQGGQYVDLGLVQEKP